MAEDVQTGGTVDQANFVSEPHLIPLKK